LTLGPAQYDAYRIHKGITGIGTDDESLLEILVHRTPSEVKAFNEAYQTMFGKSAYSAIRSDVSGDLGHIFALLSDPDNERKHPANEQKQLEDDIKDLYEASQGKTFGHETGPFITILGSRNREYIFKLYAAYANKHEISLEHIVKKWGLTTGYLEKCLIGIVTPAPEFYGRHLYDAMKGIGVNDDKLVRIILAQRERNLDLIADFFLHEYKQALKHFIKSNTSGDFQHALVNLLDFYAQELPQA